MGIYNRGELSFKAYNSFQGKAVIDKEVICESNI